MAFTPANPEAVGEGEGAARIGGRDEVWVELELGPYRRGDAAVACAAMAFTPANPEAVSEARGRRESEVRVKFGSSWSSDRINGAMLRAWKGAIETRTRSTGSGAINSCAQDH